MRGKAALLFFIALVLAIPLLSLRYRAGTARPPGRKRVVTVRVDQTNRQAAAGLSILNPSIVLLDFCLFLSLSPGHNRSMKALLTILILVGFVCSNLPARPVVQERRLRDINVISTRVLQRSISPKFYKSLLISPIKGWIVVRGNVVNTHISGARVIRSELNGAYDALALKFANDLEIAACYREDNPLTGASVLLHLLVYQIADGTMILHFPTFDEAGGNQMFYWGCARLGVLKGNGKWVEIEGPEGLHGKGWEVRPANRFLVPGPLSSQSGESSPPREKKYKPAPPRPPSSVLEPIIARTKS